MRVFETITVPAREESFLVGAFCDGCGADIVKFREHGGGIHVESASLSAGWGYFSQGKDGDHDDFEICEGCFDKVVEVLGLKRNVDGGEG